MPSGPIVSPADCREMRRLADETSYTYETIGHVVAGDERDPYHHETVNYHVNGRCAHPSE